VSAEELQLIYTIVVVKQTYTEPTPSAPMKYDAARDEREYVVGQL
jgi:hypothetical protein